MRSAADGFREVLTNASLKIYQGRPACLSLTLSVLTSPPKQRYHLGTMIRTQISLTEEQMHRLRSEAKRRGISLAALVREAVDAQVGDDEWDARKRRAMEIVGAFHSGRSDISERHDIYLDPDYEP
jgi:predicted DNA-binding protein